jgi:rsbT antagonist protein RsbS
VSTGPALVSILRQGSYLVASVHTALDDTEMIRFRNDLVEQIGRYRSTGVIIDVAALDVLDSFVARALRAIVVTAKLRGADTIIVGIQPDVAIAMVQFRLNLEPLRAALDLDAAIVLLDRMSREGAEDGG